MTAALLAHVKARTPLGWRQLRHNPTRLAVAVAGVTFANLLIFVQLGMMGALFESAVKPLRMFKADIMLLSPDVRPLGQSGTLPRRRFYQALGVDGVATGTAVQIGSLSLKNPHSVRQANVMTYGVDPEFDGFAKREISDQLYKLRIADFALLDRETRNPFGALAAKVDEGQLLQVEVTGRTLTITGLFSLGASFDSDGAAIVSDQTFLRLFPRNSSGAVNIILLQTAPGANPEEVAKRLSAVLPASDTKVMTVEGYADYIKNYMRTNTPVGFIFTFGVVIGLIIGFAIVYQILSADVNDHLAEYATFKAMGFTQSYLLGIVFEEALLLACLGFVPGILLSLAFYKVLSLGTELAISMPLTRPPMVLLFTLIMCAVSGAVATRRLKAADPADVF